MIPPLALQNSISFEWTKCFQCIFGECWTREKGFNHTDSDTHLLPLATIQLYSTSSYVGNMFCKRRKLYDLDVFKHDIIYFKLKDMCDSVVQTFCCTSKLYIPYFRLAPAITSTCWIWKPRCINFNILENHNVTTLKRHTLFLYKREISGIVTSGSVHYVMFFTRISELCYNLRRPHTYSICSWAMHD